jgi:formate hydrogenlyase subunit 4
MNYLYLFLQVIFICCLAPLISGIIKKFKNNLRMRQGASIFQPYYNLAKFFRKEEVVSEYSSWIFRITPYIVLSASIAGLFLVPVLSSGLSLNHMGDFFLLLFILSLGRFFLGLAGLDTASSFSGMGSSREMFISSLAEPVAFLAIFSLALSRGSTDLNLLSSFGVFKSSSIVAGLAFFMVTIAETSRIPIDNQETHLELTMVHEAMILEYSGRSLGLLEFAAHIKQAIFFSLIANVFMPLGLISFSGLVQLGIYLVKILFICLGIAIIEVSVAKMRLFRVVDFLSFALFLSIVALVLGAAGV